MSDPVVVERSASERPLPESINSSIGRCAAGRLLLTSSMPLRMAAETDPYFPLIGSITAILVEASGSEVTAVRRGASVLTPLPPQAESVVATMVAANSSLIGDSMGFIFFELYSCEGFSIGTRSGDVN